MFLLREPQSDLSERSAQPLLYTLSTSILSITYRFLHHSHYQYLLMASSEHSVNSGRSIEVAEEGPPIRNPLLPESGTLTIVKLADAIYPRFQAIDKRLDGIDETFKLILTRLLHSLRNCPLQFPLGRLRSQRRPGRPHLSTDSGTRFGNKSARKTLVCPKRSRP